MNEPLYTGPFSWVIIEDNKAICGLGIKAMMFLI